MDRLRIAVRTCGGCFCPFDRRKVIDDISKANSENCDFEFSYDLADDEKFDMVLLVNGCDSHCAPASEVTNNLVIDHENWERGSEVFKDALSDISR